MSLSEVAVGRENKARTHGCELVAQNDMRLREGAADSGLYQRHGAGAAGDKDRCKFCGGNVGFGKSVVDGFGKRVHPVLCGAGERFCRESESQFALNPTQIEKGFGGVAQRDFGTFDIEHQLMAAAFFK